MKLSKHTFSSKIYRYFYCTNNLPQNLCPYFWKLFLSIFLIIPLSIFRIPAGLLGEYKEILTSNYEENLLKSSLGISLGVWIFIFLFLCVLSSIQFFWMPFTDDTFIGFCGIFGLVILFVLFIAFLVWLIKSIKFFMYKKRNIKRKMKPDKVKPVNLITEFIKAKYHKYCPRIEWVDDKKTL